MSRADELAALWYELHWLLYNQMPCRHVEWGVASVMNHNQCAACHGWWRVRFNRCVARILALDPSALIPDPREKVRTPP